MPLSHAASWYLLLEAQKSGSLERFHQTVAAVAAFYCIWALYKRYIDLSVKELGQYSMGMLSVSSMVFGNRIPYLVMVATIVVILNFAMVIPFFINRGVTGIVKLVHNKEVNTLTMTWGYVFLAYLLGNLVMWSWVLWSLYKFNGAIAAEVDAD